MRIPKTSVILLLLVVCLLVVSLLSITAQASLKVEEVTVTTERPGEEEAQPNIATTTSPDTTAASEKQQSQQVTRNVEPKQIKTKKNKKNKSYGKYDLWRPSSFIDPFTSLRRMNRMMRSLFHEDLDEDNDLYRGSLWPSLIDNRRRSLARPGSWLKEIDDNFGSLIPIRSRFAKMASTVDEKDDKYVFKVVNVPQDLKKENLDIKLTYDGYRDVLDIVSNLKTDKETAFFEKRYVFPVGIDREKVVARFDEKERILTVEVSKKPDSATKPLSIKIE